MGTRVCRGLPSAYVHWPADLEVMAADTGHIAAITSRSARVSAFHRCAPARRWHTGTVQQLWPAPRAQRALSATVEVPGSKSMTNRALLLAALGERPARIVRPLRARDTDLMARALYALGVGIADAAGDLAADWAVTPAPLHGPAAVDVGLAGTVMRFVPPVAALADGPVRFDGDPHARKRPLGPLLGALRTLGAQIEDAGGSLPITI